MQNLSYYIDNRDNIIANLTKFHETRQTPISRVVDEKVIEGIFDNIIFRFLQNLNQQIIPTYSNIEYVGELYALAVLSRILTIKNFKYEVQSNGKTPDFEVRVSEFRKPFVVEVYSPTMNSTADQDNYSYYLNYEIDGEYGRPGIRAKIEEKSTKYQSTDSLISVVHILVTEMREDIVHSIELTRLYNSNHQIIFIHGTKIIWHKFQ